jgi:hypothetical protein
MGRNQIIGYGCWLDDASQPDCAALRTRRQDHEPAILNYAKKFIHLLSLLLPLYNFLIYDILHSYCLNIF